MVLLRIAFSRARARIYYKEETSQTSKLFTFVSKLDIIFNAILRKEMKLMKAFIKQFERHLRSKINLFILVASQPQL